MSTSQKKEEKFIIIALVIVEIVNLCFWMYWTNSNYTVGVWIIIYIYIFFVLVSFSKVGLAPWKERSD